MRDRSTFVRLANRRVPNAIKAVELVGNLANRMNYSFKEQDAKQIIKALRAAVVECEQRYNGEEVKLGGFQLGD